MLADAEYFLSCGDVPATLATAPVGEPTMRECRTMNEVREEIDRLDRQLVTLLAERSGYVGQAARIKTQENQIRDVARIDDVIAKVRSTVRPRASMPTSPNASGAAIESFIAHEHAQLGASTVATG